MRQVSGNNVVSKSPLRFVKPVLYLALGVIFFMTPIYTISRTINYHGVIATINSVQDMYNYFEYVFADAWHNIAIGGLFIALAISEFYDGVIRKC